MNKSRHVRKNVNFFITGFIFIAVTILIFIRVSGPGHFELSEPNQISNETYSHKKSQYSLQAMVGLNNKTDMGIIYASDPKYRDLISPRLKSKPLASDLIQQPVYVSLTTMRRRIYGLSSTVGSIIEGSVLPDHIYIFVSKEPYLLDEGVTEEFLLSKLSQSRSLIAEFPFISIVFTENIGPHRKLLPLLFDKWREDCVIITIDDHEWYAKDTLSSLIMYYNATGASFHVLSLI